jgi:cell division protein FtsZ
MTMDYEPIAEVVAHLRVVGVGGAGGNAIRSMMRSHLQGVEFLAINTDAQALAQTGAPARLRIGTKLTRGLGAGGNPEVGLRAAEESRDAIRHALAGADMVFITAGMGGGTGTGASPAVALTARELGALTVAIVTTPFAFEGEPRRSAAERGLAALREQVDTLIVVPNERLLRLAGQAMRMSQAYALADDVLRQGVQAISDLIAIPGHINLDFADVRTVMADAGSALMSIGQAAGDQRASEALRAALESPVLDLNISGAHAVLVNVTGGPDLMIHEVNAVVEGLRQQIHPDANILFGTVEDPSCEGQIKVTLVATGFEPRVARAASGGLPKVAAWRAEGPQGISAGYRSTGEDLRALPPVSARVAGDYAERDRDAPRVAREERVSGWPAGEHDRGLPAAPATPNAERDEPRAGPAQLRPAPYVAPTQPAQNGVEAPAFLRPRR